jgi:twitching motility protein PilT
LDRLLQTCVIHGGSDVWMIAGEPPMIRTQSGIQKVEVQHLAANEINELVDSIAPPSALTSLHASRNATFDFAHSHSEVFRVLVFRQLSATVAVFMRMSSPFGGSAGN